MEDLLIILTLVGVGLLVVALALYLVTIIVILWRIRHTAGLILFGVRAIAHRAAPIGEVVTDLNATLGRARDALVEVVGPVETGTPQAERMETLAETPPAAGGTPGA
jgi:hypothetical protein